MNAKRSFLAGAPTAVGVALALSLAACQNLPAASGSSAPSASAASPSPVASDLLPLTRDQLLFLDRTRHEFVLADTLGTEVRRVSDVGTLTSLSAAIDPSGRRVSYWREGQRGFELVVWDAASPTVKVVASETELRPVGTPTWTSDGDAIVTTVATAPSAGAPSAFPARGRLDVVSASGGSTRTLVTFANAGPIVALFADRDIVTGFRIGSTSATYVVLDAKTGTVRKETNASGFKFFGFEGQGRMAWGLIQPFESANATLRVWSVDDYTRETARVDLTAPEVPTTWPGRTEIAFSAGAATPGGPYEIRSLDYANGSSRTVGIMAAPVGALKFSADGSTFLVMQATVSPYVLARSTVKGTLGAATPYRVTGRSIDPSFVFIGWLRP
jgi:hypothetical protein